MLPWFEIFGLNIPAYGALGLLGFLLGMLYILLRAPRLRLSADDAAYIYVFAALGGLLGAKLLYILTVLPELAALLRAGADKVSVNSAALKNPQLIADAAYKFGSQCVVMAMDAKRRPNGAGWTLYLNGGRVDTGIDAVEWAKRAEKLGAGEILLTSMDCDGTKAGYDLELTRNISIQMGPQIRLIQSNDTMMAEKIQTTIVNTIPLWKNQMVLALGMAHSQQAMQAERAVTDATNELLRKNAATLKQGTIDIAKESERGVVDIETLQQTNRDLISTLDELNKIRADGKAKRAAAEQELGRIEGELKQKLLEINK